MMRRRSLRRTAPRTSSACAVPAMDAPMGAPRCSAASMPRVVTLAPHLLQELTSAFLSVEHEARYNGRMDARDKTGQRFGRLVVLARAPGPRVRWRCQCDCGRQAVVWAWLLGKDTRSCGCLRREVVSTTKRTHGGLSVTHRAEYHAWWDARLRCHDPSCKSYARYGARGIVMCDAWRESLETFVRDMGPRPSRRHSLERVNNSGPYAPSNCIWALPTTQQRNLRTNHLITYHGETLPLPTWAERLHVKPVTLAARLRCGWTVERAFTTPVKTKTSPHPPTC